MKRYATMALIVALSAAVAVAWAQGPQAGGGQHRQQGQHMRGPGGPGGPGGGLMLMRGTVEVNAQSKAVWDRITRLQTQMRAKQWELLTLKSQNAGEEQLRAKIEELRALQEQLRAAREEFRQFVTPAPGFGPGAGQGPRGGQGPGVHRGHRGQGQQGQGVRQGLHRGQCDGECNCPYLQDA